MLESRVGERMITHAAEITNDRNTRWIKNAQQETVPLSSAVDKQSVCRVHSTR